MQNNGIVIHNSFIWLVLLFLPLLFWLSSSSFNPISIMTEWSKGKGRQILLLALKSSSFVAISLLHLDLINSLSGTELIWVFIITLVRLWELCICLWATKMGLKDCRKRYRSAYNCVTCWCYDWRCADQWPHERCGCAADRYELWWKLAPADARVRPWPSDAPPTVMKQADHNRGSLFTSKSKP